MAFISSLFLYTETIKLNLHSFIEMSFSIDLLQIVCSGCTVKKYARDVILSSLIAAVLFNQLLQ